MDCGPFSFQNGLSSHFQTDRISLASLSIQDTKNALLLLLFTFAAPLPTGAVLFPGCDPLWVPICLEGIPQERKSLVKFLHFFHYCYHPLVSPPFVWYLRNLYLLPGISVTNTERKGGEESVVLLIFTLSQLSVLS